MLLNVKDDSHRNSDAGSVVQELIDNERLIYCRSNSLSSPRWSRCDLINSFERKTTTKRKRKSIITASTSIMMQPTILLYLFHMIVTSTAVVQVDGMTFFGIPRRCGGSSSTSSSTTISSRISSATFLNEETAAKITASSALPQPAMASTVTSSGASIVCEPSTTRISGHCRQIKQVQATIPQPNRNGKILSSAYSSSSSPSNIGNRVLVNQQDTEQQKSKNSTPEKSFSSTSETNTQPPEDDGDDATVTTDASSTATSTSTRISNPNTSTSSEVTVHTYTDRGTGLTYQALNTSLRKFVLFLLYHNVTAVMTNGMDLEDQVETETVTVPSPATADNEHDQGIDVSMKPNDLVNPSEKWRALWKQGRLLTDRTELLSPRGASSSSSNNGQRSAAGIEGFANLLGLYTDRMASMLLDEKHDNHLLLQFLYDNYGYENTTKLMKQQQEEQPKQYQFLQTQNFLPLVSRQKQHDQQLLHELKVFLNWFRSRFPYYYDRCSHCGASARDDMIAANSAAATANDENDSNQHYDGGYENDRAATCSVSDIDGVDDMVEEDGIDDSNFASDDGVDEVEEEDDEEEVDDNDDEHQTFLGYIYPSPTELVGKASRTELYRCHQCSKYTRFPRYNSATYVLESGKGRCGEYSMLLYRFLRVLGHESRWVVDWADHVWAEIHIEKRGWIHLDPCEAAVDENLTYQNWGKKQTYILGFYAPPLSSSHRMKDGIESAAAALNGVALQQQPPYSFPLIEDVTQKYTTDSWEDICQRRRGQDDTAPSNGNRNTSALDGNGSNFDRGSDENDAVQKCIDKAILELTNKLAKAAATTMTKT